MKAVLSRGLLTLLCGLVLLRGAAPARAQGEARPDLFVLAVGIDRYTPPTKDLSGCVNDALGMAKLFQAQRGKLFEQVDVQILTDAKATGAGILSGFQTLKQKGKAGDWYAIVLSGHGGMELHRWAFTAHDRNNVSDAAILELADRLAAENKKVLILIDACHAGQLRLAAHAVLNRHQDPHKGGILLMLASMPAQLSAALQTYSAFARAVEDGLAGFADYDNDQRITLKELRRFTYNRVYELRLRRLGVPGVTVDAQDCVIDASLSMPESMVLAHGHKPIPPAEEDDGPAVSLPQLSGTWIASIKDPPEIPQGSTATYRLRFDAKGVFRASLSAGGKTLFSGEGVFKVGAKAIRLHHAQGVDRLEAVRVTDAELRFRFQGRELVLGHDFVSKGYVVLDAAARLLPTDPPDRIRKGSPHKVYQVNLTGGVVYALDLKSSEFDPFLRVENAAGHELASDDDGGEDLNSRLIFTPPQTGLYRVIVTTFQGGAGNFHLRVESSVPLTTVAAGNDQIEHLKMNGAVSVTDKLTAAAPDTVRKHAYRKVYAVNLESRCRYTISLKSPAFTSHLRLEDADGNELASESERTPALGALLTFLPAQTGPYRIIVTTIQDRAVGPFTLRVETSQPGVSSADVPYKESQP